MENNYMNWCVYMHVNKINEKKYIGITSRKPEYRWGVNGKGYTEKNQKAFTAAINKYTWDGFEHIIIADGLTEDEAKNMEIELISLYKTNCCRYNNPAYGYNMTDGGDGIVGYHHTEEEKIKISQASKQHWENAEYREVQINRFTGDKNPFYGKHHTEETKEILRQASTGREVSDETRTKISQALIGIERSQETKDRMGAAQRKKYEDPMERMKISERLQEYYSDPTKHPMYGKHRSDETKAKIGEANGQAVLQFNQDGIFVYEFISQAEAERQTGICQANISKCCRKLSRTAGGYFWIRKNDYNPNDNIFNQIKPESTYTRSKEIAAIYDIPVVQLTLDGKFINEFKSMADGKRETGCIHISECCNEIREQDKCFKWMRKSDWEQLQPTIQNELEEIDELQII